MSDGKGPELEAFFDEATNTVSYLVWDADTMAGAVIDPVGLDRLLPEWRTRLEEIGFLPGELGLWKNEKSIDIIRYVGRIRGGVDMRYVNELAERFQFDLTKKVREYSSGNKRKLGIILALM